jgi:hypothetical protein
MIPNLSHKEVLLDFLKNLLFFILYTTSKQLNVLVVLGLIHLKLLDTKGYLRQYIF